MKNTIGGLLALFFMVVAASIADAAPIDAVQDTRQPDTLCKDGLMAVGECPDGYELVGAITNSVLSGGFDGSDFIYSSTSAADITRNDDGYRFIAFEGGDSYAPEWGFIEIDTTDGALETSSSLKYTVTGGRTNPEIEPATTSGSQVLHKQDYIDNPSKLASEPAGGFYVYKLNDDRANGIPEVSGANRISFYTKLPSNFNTLYHYSGVPKNYNIHFGTYTRDPDGSYGISSNLGRHFYHWFNLQGQGNYWTKIIIDQHPQHEVSQSGDPIDNPTLDSGFNYIEGLTRWYFKIKANLIQPPWTMQMDELTYYNDSRPMPPKIASIAITQASATTFIVNFASTDEGAGEGFVNRYEIRVSTSPIDSNNFYSTPIAVADAFTGDYERYIHAEVTGLDLTGIDTVYFAIRQTDENTSDIAYAEYELRR